MARWPRPRARLLAPISDDRTDDGQPGRALVLGVGRSVRLVLSCDLLIAGETALNAFAEKRKPIFQGT